MSRLLRDFRTTVRPDFHRKSDNRSICSLVSPPHGHGHAHDGRLLSHDHPIPSHGKTTRIPHLLHPPKRCPRHSAFISIRLAPTALRLHLGTTRRRCHRPLRRPFLLLADSEIGNEITYSLIITQNIFSKFHASVPYFFQHPFPAHGSDDIGLRPTNSRPSST